MMYASTKDFFKSHLDGLSLEFQASDLDEISEQVPRADALLERVLFALRLRLRCVGGLPSDFARAGGGSAHT